MRISFRDPAQALRLALLSLLSSLCWWVAALAHELNPAVTDVRIQGAAIELDIEVALETLIAGIDAQAYADSNDAPQAEEYDRLRSLDPKALEDALRANLERVTGYFRAGTDDLRSDWRLVSVDIPQVGDTELPRESRLRLAMELSGSGPVQVAGAPQLGSLILRHEDAGEDAFEGLLGPGELSPPLPRGGGAAESTWDTFVRYIILGVEHIVPKGLDHILFVLGLFFFALKWRPLLWQVTTFTLAHTITLALATLGIVTVPASVVEPLIAASIVYVAVENLRGTGDLGRWRILVVFAFGLLHGLGFASVLGEIGLGAGQFLVSLVAFNIGVELGQILVILVAYLLVGLWFGQKAFYRPYIANPASIAIAIVGAWWVVERVFL